MTAHHLLKRGKLTTLYNKRLREIAVLMYKVKNDLCPNNIKNLFNNNNNRYNLRNNDFIIPRVNTTRYGKHSIRYLGPVIWAKLDKKTRTLKTLKDFKGVINNTDIQHLIFNGQLQELHFM